MIQTKKNLFLAGCLLNIFGIWLAFALHYWHDVAQTRSAAETNASNLSRAFEEHVLRTIQHIDGLILQLRNEYQRDPRHFEERIKFQRRLGYDDVVMKISVIDARGLLAYNDQEMPVTPVDLSDREHFRIHSDMREDRLFISKPLLGRVSMKWRIHFTRRLTGKDGSFAGVIVALFRRNTSRTFPVPSISATMESSLWSAPIILSGLVHQRRWAR